MAWVCVKKLVLKIKKTILLTHTIHTSTHLFQTPFSLSLSNATTTITSTNHHHYHLPPPPQNTTYHHHSVVSSPRTTLHFKIALQINPLLKLSCFLPSSSETERWSTGYGDSEIELKGGNDGWVQIFGEIVLQSWLVTVMFSLPSLSLGFVVQI
ncbi:hypothetical protein HanXRQr2_Chr05g0218991 [Helianthus annuus]|uniref:Uncharacterized protein n=1 Tax=Helianthus annuus TaxID=4232 RepID=A0A9K3J0S0_HELAN|nr:hypothetical protein HanXRQr2_Chr05g0218991 [Helianthus annuus]KAJ0570530.1 hypothetical protein HanHA300_Chr05g0179061 [Helianthus annuus]KAJ0584877.1 hypothetical protein HanHA89_Chr05g0193801 [Helianthus annuus]KAJ0747448.1 hypothetical protein HanOQP8_Chr05g0189571 [Helianthus annuus]